MTGEEIKITLNSFGIQPSTIIYAGEQRICLYFEANEQVSFPVQQLHDSRWSTTMKCWHIPRDKSVLVTLIKLLFQNPEKEKKKEIYPESSNEFLIPDWMNDYIRQLKIRAYSSSTQKIYRSNIISFAFYYQKFDLKQLQRKEIEQYLEYLHDKKNYSASALNVMLNAIKFLYEKTWDNQRQTYLIPRAKKPKQLPRYFHQTDIEKIFNSISNIKHKVILYTAYSAGLRVSELAKLKITDIYSGSMQLRIEDAKGKKDRIVMLSPKLLSLLREYYKIYLPAYWLFEGQKGGQYSTRSIQLIIKAAKENAGVRHKGSIHALRHSFATHLLESGIDILIIKELLGHTSLRTTMIYTHVNKNRINNIKSPLDNLNL